MTIRNIFLVSGLAVFLGGCVVAPRSYPPGYYYSDRGDYYDGGYYDDGYYDYHNTPSYEGYYYARIIFISNIPYYVDDDRQIRPIPPRLYDHFRQYPYSRSGRTPVFSPDAEVREGYPMSRVVYLNGVPYYVGNGRAANPLPNNLRERFRYTPTPINTNRPQTRDNLPRNEPPAYGRDRDRFEQPAYGRDRNEPMPDRGPRNGGDGGYPDNSNGRMMPMTPAEGGDPRGMPPMREQRAFPRQDQQDNPDMPIRGNEGNPYNSNGRMMPRDGSRMPPLRQEQGVPQQYQQDGPVPRGNVPFNGARPRPDARPQPNGGNRQAPPENRKGRVNRDEERGNGRGGNRD